MRHTYNSMSIPCRIVCLQTGRQSCGHRSAAAFIHYHRITCTTHIVIISYPPRPHWVRAREFANLLFFYFPRSFFTGHAPLSHTLIVSSPVDWLQFVCFFFLVFFYHAETLSISLHSRVALPATASASAAAVAGPSEYVRCRDFRNGKFASVLRFPTSPSLYYRCFGTTRYIHGARLTLVDFLFYFFLLEFSQQNSASRVLYGTYHLCRLECIVCWP